MLTGSKFAGQSSLDILLSRLIGNIAGFKGSTLAPHTLSLVDGALEALGALQLGIETGADPEGHSAPIITPAGLSKEDIGDPTKAFQSMRS